MKCNKCGKTIGNTLYEIGTEGQTNYKRLCPVCYLGKEGLEEKYQKFDNSWTETKLKDHKDKMKEEKP